MTATAVRASELDPYVGPRPFARTEDDQGRFFGRDRESEEIVSLVLSHSVVLVYAQSGAGKTSLFEAKVVSGLEAKGFQVSPLTRVRAAIPEGVDSTSIGNLYVYAALLGISPDEQPSAGGSDSLAATTLDAYLKAHAQDPAAPRCIVFDQFEEIFTDESVFALRPTRWQEEQEAFFRQVAQAVAEDPLLRVVFVIRKEHLAELDRFAALLPEGLRTRYHLEPLGRQAALAAVTFPLLSTNRSFGVGVAEELVEKLLLMRVDLGKGEIRQVPGRFVEPLHLQLVCQSLWEDIAPEVTVITKDHLRSLADIDLVLGDLYDEAVRTAAAAAHMPEKRLRRQIERDFITPAGTRGTVFVGDPVDGSGRRRAVAELEHQHLIRAEWRAGADWYELTHDRLIEPILSSNARHRAERAKRVRRWLAAALALAAVIGGIAAGVLLTQTTEASPEQLFELVEQAELPDPGNSAISQAAFSPDGRFVVTASADGVARVWDWQVEKLAAELGQQGDSPLSDAAFSPEGSRVVTASADGVARVWDLKAEKVAAELGQQGNSPLSDAAFNPNGTRIVTASQNGTARVWDWSGGKIEAVLTQPSSPAPLYGAAFSPDGNRVVTASADSTARIWKWHENEVDAVLIHPAQVTSAAFFSPIGGAVATASADGTARIWNWHERKVDAVLRASQQPAPLFSAAFSPAGALVVTAGEDGFARIYGPRSASS